MFKAKTIWHNLNVSKILEVLVTKKTGLSTREASKRSEKYGENILAQAQKFSAWRLFFAQFKSALVYVLLIAGLISLVFGEFVDAYVIFAAVGLNVVIGFWQEKKANSSLEQLSKVVKKEAIVLRDGHEVKIEARYLVSGDVILLQAGDRVPADARK